MELIQALTPIGLEAVNEVLQRDVCQLTGESACAEENTAGTADGWRTTYPDASAAEVESQEEYASRECTEP